MHYVDPRGEDNLLEDWEGLKWAWAGIIHTACDEECAIDILGVDKASILGDCLDKSPYTRGSSDDNIFVLACYRDASGETQTWAADQLEQVQGCVQCAIALAPTAGTTFLRHPYTRIRRGHEGAVVFSVAKR